MGTDMTQRLYEDDGQLAEMRAQVVWSGPDGVVLDRTVFYARGGGQPGDIGTLRWDAGEMRVTDTIKGEGGDDPAYDRGRRRRCLRSARRCPASSIGTGGIG
jgi:Ser-tRNA(Ala) deacylase AlaX